MFTYSGTQIIISDIEDGLDVRLLNHFITVRGEWSFVIQQGKGSHKVLDH